MKKIKCPKCNQEISLEEFADANSNIYKDFEKKAERVAEDKVKERISKIQQEREEEKRQLQESLREKSQEELNKREFEIVKLQEQLKAQKELENKQREINEKLAQKEVTLAKEKFEIEYKQKELSNKRIVESLQEEINKMKQQTVSQELVGEYGEEFIKEMIQEALPKDQIEDVKKGVLGADLIIRIKERGKTYGSILVEVKNTKQWKDEWIQKLQNDLKNSGCEVGLLISKSQPKKNKKTGHSFEMYNDNLFSCSFKETVPIVTLLRQKVYEIYNLSKDQESISSAKDILYREINSPRFKQGVQIIIDRFSSMKNEYEKQQLSMHRSFERQKQHLNILIKQVIELDEIVNTTLLEPPTKKDDEE